MDFPLSSETMSALQDVAVTKYIGISAVTLCVYEFLLNIADEIEFVWRKPIRLGQILYLLNRYFSSIGLLLTVAFLLAPPRTPRFCNAWPYFILVQFGLSTLLIQTVLVARVCAIYKPSRIIRIISVVGCAAVVIETAWIGTVIIVKKSWSRLSIPGMVDMCAPSHDGSPPPWRYVYWIYPILFQAFLFVLVVCRAWLDIGFADEKSLIRVIIRDSSLTFLWNLLLQFSSIFIWRYASGGLSETPAMMGNALDVALATRLLLNMWIRFYRREPSLSTLPEEPGSPAVETPRPPRRAIGADSSDFWTA